MANLQDVLSKKLISGLATANPGSSFTVETISSRPAIFASQLYKDTIPSTAPTDLTVATVPAASDNTNNTVTGTIRAVSTASTFIEKYTKLPLYDAVGAGKSFVYSNTQSNNVLSQVIPYSYDPLGSYQYTVYGKNGSPMSPSDPDYPWILDTDAGVLTFIGSNSLAKTDARYPPNITFWRYNGAFGVTGSGGASSGADLSLTGRLMVSGDVSFNNRLTVAGNVTFNSFMGVGIGNALPQCAIDTPGTVNCGTVSQFGATGNTLNTTPVSGTYSTQVVANAGLIIGNAAPNGVTNVFTSNALTNTINNGLTVNGLLNAINDVSMNGRLNVAGDVSMNGNVTIRGGLNVQQLQNTSIINMTTTNYRFIMAEDLSLNGRLYATGDVSMNGNVFISSDLSCNGNLVAGNLTAFSGKTVKSDTYSLQYATLPTYTANQIGYSYASTTTTATSSGTIDTPLTALTSPSMVPGVYICEGQLWYGISTVGIMMHISISNTTNVMNAQNQQFAFTTVSGQGGTMRITTVMTITNASTFYLISRAGATSVPLTNCYLKLTRIA